MSVVTAGLPKPGLIGLCSAGCGEVNRLWKHARFSGKWPNGICTSCYQIEKSAWKLQAGEKPEASKISMTIKSEPEAEEPERFGPGQLPIGRAETNGAKRPAGRRRAYTRRCRLCKKPAHGDGETCPKALSNGVGVGKKAPNGALNLARMTVDTLTAALEKLKFEYAAKVAEAEKEVILWQCRMDVTQENIDRIREGTI